jgi:CheY-like chemotaxis protein
MRDQRLRPLVLVASPDRELAQRLMRDVERSGAVACVAHSAAGCLRVATAVGPDVVLLDSSLPQNLRGMLSSHPATASTVILSIAGRVVAGGSVSADIVSGFRSVAATFRSGPIRPLTR